MPNIPVKNCCGCTACMSVCPASAIKMEADGEGFIYPVVESSLCINCGKCEKVCPILVSPKLPENFEGAYVTRSKSQEVLNESTSGGFVDVLCKYITENKGYVAGAAFDQNFMVHHKIVNSYDDAKAFRNSKYAQSEMGKVFRDIKSLLDEGERVMFIGTPCQVGGLKTFIGEEENLITVDLVCRSIPSPKLWETYLDWQENKNHSAIKKVVCRNKTYGYHSGTLKIEFENGKVYSGSNRVDYYMKSFHENICSRPSCYECNFKTKHRVSDFTVFDCWYPHLVTDSVVSDDNKGYSNLLIHTKKGMDILASLTDVCLYRADANKMFLYTGGMESTSIGYKEERKNFYKDLDKLGFEKAIKSKVNVSAKDRIIEGAKPLYYKLKRR